MYVSILLRMIVVHWVPESFVVRVFFTLNGFVLPVEIRRKSVLPVPILRPYREIQALCVVTKLLIRHIRDTPVFMYIDCPAVSRVVNATPCHRTGYDRHDIRILEEPKTNRKKQGKTNRENKKKMPSSSKIVWSSNIIARTTVTGTLSSLW